MASPKELYFEKRGKLLVKNLQSRHFEAYYCANKEEALSKALELIPEGTSVGWGGALTVQQIGLADAVKKGNYHVFDRDSCKTPEEKTQIQQQIMFADTFLMGANALSLDGQMVSIDGTGNRVAALIYGPKSVIVVAGMNKVMDNLEQAYHRARTVAAPTNQQRFEGATPCTVTGVCGDCKSECSICNQIVITRNCRPAGRIKFILVGEELGL